MNWKYFKIEEFDDPNVEGSAAENMDFDFITLLNTIRHQSGVQMRITSGYRTEETNSKLKNSVPNSSHLKGVAADIACNNSSDREKIIAAAIKNKVRRIGISAKFLHIDVDSEKQPAVWLYGGKSSKSAYTLE